MSEEKVVNEEKIIIDKDTIVAYCSFYGCHCYPFGDEETNRVKFVVTGQVSEALASLNSNNSIPILDYLNRLGMVRSILFQFKDQFLKRQKNGVTTK